LLDEASGVRKEEAELVVVSRTPKQPRSGGWNKVNSIVSSKLTLIKEVTFPPLPFDQTVSPEKLSVNFCMER